MALSKCFTCKQFKIRGGQDAYTNFTNIVRRRMAKAELEPMLESTYWTTKHTFSIPLHAYYNKRNLWRMSFGPDLQHCNRLISGFNGLSSRTDGTATSMVAVAVVYQQWGPCHPYVHWSWQSHETLHCLFL